MPTTTETPEGTSLSQTEVWIDRQGVEHRIDDMSVRYKANVIGFLERRAPHIVAQALVDDLINRLGAHPTVMQCVIGERADGTPIECGATHEWAHGAWHGIGPHPDSMAALDVDAHGLAEVLNFPAITNEEAVELMRKTPLVARLIDDVANGRGGEDD